MIFQCNRVKHLFTLATLVTYMGFALSSCVTNNKCFLTDTKSEDFLSNIDTKFLKYKNCVQEYRGLMNTIHKNRSYNSVNAKLLNEKINEENNSLEDIKTYLKKSLDIEIYKKLESDIISLNDKYEFYQEEAESNFVKLLHSLNSIINKSDRNLSTEIEKVIIDFTKAQKSRHIGAPDGIYQQNFAISKLLVLFDKVKNKDIKIIFSSAHNTYAEIGYAIAEMQNIEEMNALKNLKEFVATGKKSNYKF